MEQNNPSQSSNQGNDPDQAPPPASLPLYDRLGTFLTLQENISQTQKNVQSSTKTATSQHSPATISLLNLRLQSLHLGAPIWDITVEPGTEHSAQRFIGTLSIGQDLPEKINVSILEPGANPMGAGLPSKKDVKTKLAQKALDLLEGMPALLKSSDTSTTAVTKIKHGGDEDGINWIGRILEYNNSIPLESRVLTYTESSTPPPRNSGPFPFGCTVDLAIPTSSLGPEIQSFAPYTTCKFPASDVLPTFPTKKGAKYHCSRLAGLELIKLGLIRKDGTLPPKSIIPPPQSHVASNEPTVSKFIPQRCEQLGLPPPHYEFTCPSGGDSSSVNAFVDCSAHFPSIFGLPDPLAVVRNVYGKKRAKEECARALVDMLDKVERWRLKGSGLWEES